MRKAKCRNVGKDVNQDVKVKGTAPNTTKELHTTTTEKQVCNLINEYDGQLDFLSSLSREELNTLIQFIVSFIELKNLSKNDQNNTKIL